MLHNKQKKMVVKSNSSMASQANDTTSVYHSLSLTHPVNIKTKATNFIPLTLTQLLELYLTKGKTMNEKLYQSVVQLAGGTKRVQSIIDAIYTIKTYETRALKDVFTNETFPNDLAQQLATNIGNDYSLINSISLAYTPLIKETFSMSLMREETNSGEAIVNGLLTRANLRIAENAQVTTPTQRRTPAPLNLATETPITASYIPTYAENSPALDFTNTEEKPYYSNQRVCFHISPSSSAFFQPVHDITPPPKLITPSAQTKFEC